MGYARYLILWMMCIVANAQVSVSTEDLMKALEQGLSDVEPEVLNNTLIEEYEEEELEDEGSESPLQLIEVNRNFHLGSQIKNVFYAIKNTELFSMKIPDGWNMQYALEDGLLFKRFEWFPEGETIEKWQQALVLQILSDIQPKNRQRLLRTFYVDYQDRCEEHDKLEPMDDFVDRFSAEIHILTCKKFKDSDESEHMFVIMVTGAEGTYLISRRWRFDEPQEDTLMLPMGEFIGALNIRDNLHVCAHEVGRTLCEDNLLLQVSQTLYQKFPQHVWLKDFARYDYTIRRKFIKRLENSE